MFFFKFLVALLNLASYKLTLGESSFAVSPGWSEVLLKYPDPVGFPPVGVVRHPLQEQAVYRPVPLSPPTCAKTLGSKDK